MRLARRSQRASHWQPKFLHFDSIDSSAVDDGRDQVVITATLSMTVENCAVLSVEKCAVLLSV